MHPLLEDLRDAWSPDNKEARNEVVARAKADAYVDAFPEQFTGWEEMSVAELVQAVDLFRQSGMENDRWKVEAWLLHRYEPQNIGGIAEPQVRIR
jgi:predicted ATPase